MNLSIDKGIKDLQRKEFIEAMHKTNCGWNPKGRFSHVGCPTDLQFVTEKDLPHNGLCFMECEDCWQYVLNTKWRKGRS